MAKYLKYLIAFITITISSCSVDVVENSPQIINEGFDSLASKGPTEAINVWCASWSKEDEEAKSTLINSLNNAQSVLGKYVGYELVKSVYIGKHTQHTYIVMLFESRQMFAKFSLYKTPAGVWRVLLINWNSNIDEIIPAEIYLNNK